MDYRYGHLKINWIDLSSGFRYLTMREDLVVSPAVLQHQERGGGTMK